ncbi:hypothetical protein BV25DRAFT_19738 [Artomyces pyxidatus]|uniref:Uncharacterized protein n=1 Tax=Artomyces pyxidatus TaxID=48021 RepID=A0ACB8TJP7_9AGAM|nr:hypothetical protein BV25DRAFT_19738 [Artomyces pyxidatus]
MQSTLYGLTFASLISSLISFTVPPLMGTVGYRIANDWLTASAYPESSERAPTPLQYGIMIRLFSSSNIFALLESGMYLSKRARTASYIIPGFVVLAFVLVVSHGISIVDLWLHSTSGTLVYDAVSPISDLSQLSFGTTIDTISCPFSGFSQGVNSNAPGITCQVYQLESNNALMEASLGVADNRSSDRQVVMLGDMAVVIVPAAASSGLSSLTMDTLGMSASCAPPPCLPVDVPILAPNSCQIQTNTSVAPTSFLFHPSSGPVPANWTQATTNPFGIFVALSYSMLEVMLAPVGISVSFNSSSNVWLPAPSTSPTSWAIETNDVLSYNSFCNITTYNVTVNYRAGGYSIVNKVPSDFNTMSAVSAGFTEYLAQLYLLPGITTALHSQITNRDFDSQFAAQLASYGLALSGGLMTSQPVSEAIQASQRVASRYPLAPLVTFLALLYLYSLTALGILLWTALFCKAGSVVVHLPDGTTKTVGLLELAQLRLTSPIAMVADTFQSPINGRRRDAELKGNSDVDRRILQSIATNPLHLFGDDAQRLTIGIRSDGFRMERIGWHDSDEDGESTSLINDA